MNFKEFLKAMQTIEDDRKITKEIVIAALQEALAKAYRKHIDIPDVLVRVDINEANGQIHVYQQYTVVEEVEDEELEVALADVKDKGYQLGDLVDHEVDISQIGRAAALLAKNVMKQKIREAEKQAVYDEYIDQLDEMVTGMIESVEEKFVVVNLGKTMALMPRAAQIPGERYVEGQSIRVVITECNEDAQGAQVLVSRSDAKLVKRADGVWAEFGNNAIKVPDAKVRKLVDDSYIGKEVVMGIRPENIHDEERFLSAADNNLVEAKVEVVELMGSETYLYLKVDGKDSNVVARVDPRSTSRTGDTVKVAFETNRLHFFDKDTELSILNR